MIGADLWRGKFGDDYTDRNYVNWQARIPFWERVFWVTGARSAFEVGCNAGWNLSALAAAAKLPIRVAGSDVNERALEQATAAGLEVYNCLDFRGVSGRSDLVFTAGLLIHIETEHVREVMQAIIDKSFRWVVAVEYESDVEEAVTYRGHADKCWRRPYGKMYQELGLTLHARWAQPDGFDNCTAWLLMK